MVTSRSVSPGWHVLTRSSRLTSSEQFARTVRQGRRAGTSTIVLHLDLPAEGTAAAPAQVGFVVGKAVGPAVVRNKVKRRLRHLTRERLSSLPGSAVLVVRALPAASAASYSALGADLESALTRVLSKQRSGGRAS